jgi:hypothetical protein
MIDLTPRSNFSPLWRERWSDRFDPLFELLCSADRGNLEVAMELLRKVRELREALAASEMPDLALRQTFETLIDEIWEGACAAVYGDLETVRQRTFRVLELAQDLHEPLFPEGN